MSFSDAQKLNLRFKYEPEANFFLAENLETNLYDYNKSFRLLQKESLFSKNFQYLNASRFEPKSINPKNFTSVVNDRNIGNHGEYTAHYIEVFYNDDIVFENLLHKDSVIKDEIREENIINRTLINQINLWMGEISQNINIRTTSNIF